MLLPHRVNGSFVRIYKFTRPMRFGRLLYRSHSNSSITNIGCFSAEDFSIVLNPDINRMNEHDAGIISHVVCLTTKFLIDKAVLSCTNSSTTTKGELSSVKAWIHMITFPCTSLITWGMISAFPVLFVAFLEKFQKSRSETSTIGSLQIGLLYMLAVIPGYLIPIYGFRIILIVGSLITVTGFISSIFVAEMHILYITMGVITSLGASIMLTATDSAPLVVFKKWRSLATILCSTTGSLGFATIPLTVSPVILHLKHKCEEGLMAGIILQAVVLGMLYPSAYKKSIDSENHELDSKESDVHKEVSARKNYIKILKSPTFWCLGAAGLALDSLSNSCRVLLLDRAILQGIPESKAVLSISLWGIFSAACKLCVQVPFINKTPKRRQVTLVTVIVFWCVVTLGSVVLKSYEGFLAYCILAGICHGFKGLLWYLVLADTTERELVVSAYSLQCLIADPFVMFSVPIAGMIYDATQSYDVPYIFFGCLGLVGSICEAFIPYFEKKIKKKIRINSPSYPNAA